MPVNDIMRKIFVIFGLILMVLVFSGCVQEAKKPVACTLDAKVCPDGSVVGRVGPDCEFAKCPETTTEPATDTPLPKHFPKTPIPSVQSVCAEGETKDAVCPDGVTSYLFENCVDGEWHTVMYIRDPCTHVSGTSKIDSFEDCVAAGFPIMESYPRQCRAEGKLFVEKI